MAVYARVSMVILVPDSDATDDDVREWIKFELGEFGDMERDNPLINHALEIEENTFLIGIDE